jgi:hypothetical protein
MYGGGGENRGAPYAPATSAPYGASGSGFGDDDHSSEALRENPHLEFLKEEMAESYCQREQCLKNLAEIDSKIRKQMNGFFQYASEIETNTIFN